MINLKNKLLFLLLFFFFLSASSYGKNLEIPKMEMTLEAFPEKEMMKVQVTLSIKKKKDQKKISFRFLKPQKIGRIWEVNSKRDLPYEIKVIHKQTGEDYHKRIEEMRTGYKNLAAFLNALKKLRDQGKSLKEVSKFFKMPTEQIGPYWPYAKQGELPITDHRVYLPLYFLKGALALHSLRKHLGEEVFFKGFRLVFEKSSEKELTLDYFRSCFEKASGKKLEIFFKKWYYERGLPKGK